MSLDRAAPMTWERYLRLPQPHDRPGVRECFCCQRRAVIAGGREYDDGWFCAGCVERLGDEA